MLTQDELKTQVGLAALHYVVPGDIIGVGTGSTVNKFIDALASMKGQIRGAVSSSEASTVRLKALGIPVVYYISPQLWAWRSGRMRTMQQYVDRVLVIFPFEEAIYRDAGVPVLLEFITSNETSISTPK